VELSLFPNWIGVDQERLVDLRGERLTLSTRALLLRGIQQTAHLIWERISTSKQQALIHQVPRIGVLGSSRPEIATWHTKTVLLEDVL
jgi:hypothetical protein